MAALSWLAGGRSPPPRHNPLATCSSPQHELQRCRPARDHPHGGAGAADDQPWDGVTYRCNMVGVGPSTTDRPPWGRHHPVRCHRRRHDVQQPDACRRSPRPVPPLQPAEHVRPCAAFATGVCCGGAGPIRDADLRRQRSQLIDATCARVRQGGLRLYVLTRRSSTTPSRDRRARQPRHRTTNLSVSTQRTSIWDGSRPA